MDPETRLPPPDAMPTGARLRFDSGQAFVIGGQLVVGRIAASPVDLVTHPAIVCPVGDTAGLSRRHAAIEPHGGCWAVDDLGSLNGSFVWDRFARRWERIRPGQRALVAPGTRLAFGWRTCVVESWPAQIRS